ncbi:Dam family site-specific DNA-(adenine-N6)-methyltransferase [Rahnella aceris]|uniref:Dam family site-specific DNA-(adenine-N6)-methyltransferase n=1 Tax=Rahnella sp. (strain Y9602) TaxID=2703885 RepID=UPI001C260181|nr:Dam family site-specific DNA-(adenine-N6)-methyltransferase [Rahnella aceris]MBU9841057.1 Dam family site-specific DNA-(adenine-N6)-methyltransferase [Rahnella aceris]
MKTVLKWAGSKVRIIETLKQHLPAGQRLVEPFAGSCAVMMNTNYPEYLIADINPDLINLYRAIKSNPDQFITVASELFACGNTSESYYEFRALFNDLDEARLNRAALFLYLNRHCYNGLCRYNKKGEFNVPYGKLKKPYFPKAEILAFAEKAQLATFICGNYSEALKAAQTGDVVYCDPPYLTETANFTAYHTSGFGHEEHGRLARAARRLAGQGVPVVLSNSDAEMVHYLYKDFSISRITAPRSIGAAAGSQKSALELIIKSSKINGEDELCPIK